MGFSDAAWPKVTDGPESHPYLGNIRAGQQVDETVEFRLACLPG